MARKKAESVVSEDVENEVVVEPQTTVEEKEEVHEVPVKEPVVAEPVEVPSIDVDAELDFAQSQIEHCEDYLNVQGADYKGYMRGKIKEWRLYKYKVRQYSIGHATLPARPEPVIDY